MPDVKEILNAIAQAAGVTMSDAGLILVRLRDRGFDVVPRRNN